MLQVSELTYDTYHHQTKRKSWTNINFSENDTKPSNSSYFFYLAIFYTSYMCQETRTKLWRSLRLFNIVFLNGQYISDHRDVEEKQCTLWGLTHALQKTYFRRGQYISDNRDMKNSALCRDRTCALSNTRLKRTP